MENQDRYTQLSLKMGIIDKLESFVNKYKENKANGFETDFNLYGDTFEKLELLGLSPEDTKTPINLFKKLDELSEEQLYNILDLLSKRTERLDIGVNESTIMKNKKLNKVLLNEELKKFNKLINYDYYDSGLNENFTFPVVNSEDDRGGEVEDPSKIIYGSGLSEEDDVENIDNQGSDLESDATDIANELGADDTNLDLGSETPENGTPEVNAEPAPEVDTELDVPAEEPAPSDEIELDVTELVKGSEAAKQSADMANSKIEQLMSMVDKLEGQLSTMSSISNKIDDLEKEIEKRNPTPKERLEMRSLDSYPYNIKLSDFWAEKGGNYETGTELDNKPKEYVLTQQDVDNDYSESEIEDSFDYEEEDV